MTKTRRKTNNFADVLATEPQFVVLTKTGRVQILVEPTPKQLRKRGKRGWQLSGTVEQQPDSEQILAQLVQTAISVVKSADGAAGKKERKPKSAKVAKE